MLHFSYIGQRFAAALLPRLFGKNIRCKCSNSAWGQRCQEVEQCFDGYCYDQGADFSCQWSWICSGRKERWSGAAWEGCWVFANYLLNSHICAELKANCYWMFVTLQAENIAAENFATSLLDHICLSLKRQSSRWYCGDCFNIQKTLIVYIGNLQRGRLSYTI